MKKHLVVIIFTMSFIFCSSQEVKTEQKTEQHRFVYQRNNQTTWDTIVFQDTAVRNELLRMMNDPNYKPRKPNNDTIFNFQGNPIAVKLGCDIFGASIQKFEYDKQNRLVKIIGYDNQKNIKPFDKDIAITINLYDGKGNLIEIQNFSENGKLISAEFEDTPIIRMKYNEANQLIEEWYLDENENLRSEFAIFKYEYNSKGERIAKGWYNQKGEKE